MKFHNYYSSVISKACSSKVFLLTGIVMISVMSCTINDPVGDISKPGYITANIYWDVPVTNVTAGNDVSFYAEYWSLDNTFPSLGVWYNVRKNLKYALTYPGNGYTFTLDSTELSREFIEVRSFQHSAGSYVQDKKAYVIESSFPVSYTLSSLEYKNPVSYNSEQFGKLIPVSVRNRFVSNLFPLLNYQDLKTLLVTDRQIVPAETFETWFAQASSGGTTIYTLKDEFKNQVRTYLNEVPFSAFIYNRNRQFFAVEFLQGYELNARFRIVNGTGVENFSDWKRITVF